MAMMLLAGMAVSLSPFPSSHASEYVFGRLVQATPFDQKLFGAGFFNLQFAGSTSQSVSMEELFMVARSFRYVEDRRADSWQSPEITDTKRSGDCEDKAVWLYWQLRRNGYQARLVIGKYRAFQRRLHVWVMATDPRSGNTYLLDPAAQRRIWQTGDFPSGFYKPEYSFDGGQRYKHTHSS